MAPKKKKATPRKRVKPSPDRLAGLEQRMRDLADRIVRRDGVMADLESRITNGEKNVEFLSRADAEQRERLAKLEKLQRGSQTQEREPALSDRIPAADKLVIIRRRLKVMLEELA